MDVQAVSAPISTGVRPRWAAWVAWALLVGCAGLLVGALVTGERESTYDDLRRAVRAGEVENVTVDGGMTAPYRGRMGVTVHWRAGLVAHVAPVTEQHPVRRSVIDGSPVVHDVVDDLTGLDPDVEVVRHPHEHDFGGATVLGAWRLPTWAGAAWLAIWVVTLCLLIAGPRPWRATRWAWFWLLCIVPPVGAVAFLLMGGHTGRWPPRHPETRLTGGRAFLLAIVVSVVVSVVTGAVTGALA